MEDGFFYALALLLAVVVKQPKGIAAQQDNSHQVAGREESHEEIDDVPHQFETGQRSEYDHEACRADAINGHDGRVGGDEADVRLTVIVIADNAGKGEKENSNGYEDGTC